MHWSFANTCVWNEPVLTWIGDDIGGINFINHDSILNILLSLKELGIKLLDEEVKQLLDELDKDGDGEINYR